MIVEHGRFAVGARDAQGSTVDATPSSQTIANALVSGSKVIDESRIKDFIKHWERIIYPYNEENDQHRAVKTVLVELENVCRAYCH